MDSERGLSPQGSCQNGGSTTDLEKRLATAVVSALHTRLVELAEGLRAHFTPELVENIIAERLRSARDEDNSVLVTGVDRMIGEGELAVRSGEVDEGPSSPQINEGASENQRLASPQTPLGVVEDDKSSRKMEFIIAGKYRLKRKIGSGSFGDILLSEDINTHEEVAIKMESTYAQCPQLSKEYNIYQRLQGGVGIPQIYWFGEERDYKALVMDFLGPCLEELKVARSCSGKMSLKSVLMLADQMISLVEYVHNMGYLHKDIKPENFLMGDGCNYTRLYLIDFGLSTQYLDKRNTHIPKKTGRSLVGTIRYAPVNAHLGVELSRRDDLESLGYILIYLLNGSLPWQGIPGSKNERKEKVKEAKNSISPDELCEGLPREFSMYFTYCRALRFEGTPDYDYLRQLFNNVFESYKFVRDDIYDWTNNSGGGGGCRREPGRQRKIQQAVL